MTPDEKADKIIMGLTATGAAAGALPVPLLIPFMGTVAGGVVAIGACYGVGLSRDEAWKLIREFFKAAGFVWTSAFIGTQLIAWIVTTTGVGVPVAMALETAEATLIAYAVGTAAKHYFKGQKSRDEIRTVMRSAMSEARTKFSSKVVDRV
jgi:hypothetical protein